MQVSALIADEDRCVPPNLALAISSRQSIPAPGPPDLRGGRGHRCPEDGSAERAALPHLGKCFRRDPEVASHRAHAPDRLRLAKAPQWPGSAAEDALHAEIRDGNDVSKAAEIGRAHV